MADDIGLFVQVEDAFGVARVGHVGENIADLSPHVVSVSAEQLQDALHEGLSRNDCLHLALAASSNVGKNPACLTSCHLLGMG